MINLFKKSFKFKTLKSAKGFSLVELMVVVAIIGILATMAIPQVTKFMAKARQAEAKLLLGSMYTAEKGYYVEHSTYNNNFQQIGFSPEGRVRYNGGFSGIDGETAGAALIQEGVAVIESAPMTIEAICALPNSPCTLMSEGSAYQTMYSAEGKEAKVYKETFIACAGAQLVAGKTDEWIINEKKEISQPQNGLE
jgi:type IV pilus assembly protein PilA